MAEIKASLSASGAALGQRGRYWGYTVTTVIGAGPVTVFDNTSAAGTVIDVIPAATVAGTTKTLTTPLPCAIGVFASLAGTTGTVVFLCD